MLFFEAGEDDDPHIYLAPGVLPGWLRGADPTVRVAGAPTVFGQEFGYTLRHDAAGRRVTIDIPEPLPGVRYVHTCRLGRVVTAHADGGPAPTNGADVHVPAGVRHVEITYA
jgi:hypothetical protein